MLIKVLLWLCIFVSGVMVYINFQTNLTEQSLRDYTPMTYASYPDRLDNQPQSEYKPSEAVFVSELASIPINQADGLTGLYNVQSVDGYRTFQPTFNPNNMRGFNYVR